ncbi:nuclear transport factor 2 family protein [Niabella yanshanensis]|uniref:Nuclear transport factor 2 family protein n=1 Tax=Niabella yanshanensis TaxID=577386 RepID=A0ABZ0W7I8_9BACT|nr:nuclear transport factor 2 family protein [Niabella yanshanensis]WQD38629.1 nuclear transport factor 2 family protein [Niabella yanshanensis]
MNNKEILLKANEQISKGNYDGFLNYCTEDTRWEFIGEQTLNGKVEIKAYMKAAYLKPPKVAVDQLITEGDFLVAQGTIELLDADGTWKGYDYCDVWQIFDGKLASLKAYVVPRN